VKVSALESLGCFGMKQHKPLFIEEGSKSLDEKEAD
jgi:hypothetical protein